MHANQLIRRLIWLYFILWIVEGALRFWVLPSLSNPLLIVRDPVVILIYLAALSSGVMPRNVFTIGSIILSVVAFLAAILVGHGSFLVALYGVRATFLHLPLIFVIQRVCRKEDIEQICRVVLWLSVPMAFLAVYQFRSPAESWINQGGMRAHYSTVRPAGTFSFVSGMVAFASLVSAFLAHSFTSMRSFGLVRSASAAVAALAMVAVSNSRTMAFSVGIIFVMMVGLVFFRGTKVIGSVLLIGVIGLASTTLSTTEFFADGTQSLKRRFLDNATSSGIIESAFQRVFGNFMEGFYASNEAALLGQGIGYGTNAGAMLLTGKREFLGGETDWSRTIVELGPILGWIFLAMRSAIAWQMLKAGLKSLKAGNLLPMLLFGAGVVTVLIGQWGVPTNQGFATLVAGFCLAASRTIVSLSLSSRPDKRKQNESGDMRLTQPSSFGLERPAHISTAT